MRCNGLVLHKVMSMKIRVSSLIECLSICCVFIFSSYDCLIRLFPWIPFSALRLLLFGGLFLGATVFRKAGNQNNMIFLLLMYSIIGFEYLLASDTQAVYIKTLFFNITSLSCLWVYFFAFSLVEQPIKWHKRMVLLAYFNMFLLILTTMAGRYSTADRVLNYVGLGISAAMWIPLMIQSIFLTEGRIRVFHVIGTSISIVFIGVYGNRGSLVAIFSYVMYCILKYTKAKHKVLIVFFLCFGCWIIYKYQALIIAFVVNIVSDLGIFSRNLNLLLNGKITYTTHRTDEIWVRIIEAIDKRPLLGYGLCYDRVLSGAIGIYAHNIVLEVFVSFGIPIGGFLLILHIFLAGKFILGQVDSGWERLFSPFWITSTVLLMFNNSFCQLGFFWIPYGVFFAYLKSRRKRRLRSGKG